MPNTRRSADTVFEAVEDLHNQEQIVTRETLAEVTGLKLSVIDDRLAYLVDNGKILRVQRGVFVPAPVHHPARYISKTLLPDGTVKIEIGDDVLTLTPREDRALARLMVGAAQEYSAIEIGHQAAHFANELRAQIRQIRRDVSILQEEMGDETEADSNVTVAHQGVTKKVTKKSGLSENTPKRCL
jgi:hypothetical protein